MWTYEYMGFDRLVHGLWSMFNNVRPEGSDASSGSVLESGGLRTVDLGGNPWKIPEELLACSLCWKAEEIEINTGFISRIASLARESKDKQAKSKIFFFHLLLFGLPPGGVAQI